MKRCVTPGHKFIILCFHPASDFVLVLKMCLAMTAAILWSFETKLQSFTKLLDWTFKSVSLRSLLKTLVHPVFPPKTFKSSVIG